VITASRCHPSSLTPVGDDEPTQKKKRRQNKNRTNGPRFGCVCVALRGTHEPTTERGASARIRHVFRCSCCPREHPDTPVNPLPCADQDHVWSLQPLWCAARQGLTSAQQSDHISDQRHKTHSNKHHHAPRDTLPTFHPLLVWLVGGVHQRSVSVSCENVLASASVQDTPLEDCSCTSMLSHVFCMFEYVCVPSLIGIVLSCPHMHGRAPTPAPSSPTSLLFLATLCVSWWAHVVRLF
jgi:hypothetical protein